MKLEDALPLAEKVVAILQPFCERVCIAGSLRRERAEVNDVDLVALPKSCEYTTPLGVGYRYNESSVWTQLIPAALKKCGLKVEVSGQELLRFSLGEAFLSDGFQVDVYRARPGTWGVILLVRTGSKEHNVKLCSLARSKGLMLSAAQGVLEMRDTGLKPPRELPRVLASATEEEIFKALGLAFVEPKDREVRF